MLKKNMFLRAILHRILAFLLLKIEPKSMFFNTFFENVDFVKIIVFLKKNCYFSGLGPPKIHPKSMPKRARKKHGQKPPQKSIFRSSWPPKNLLKSTKNRKKNSSKKRLKTKLVSRRYGNRAQVVGN